MSRANALRTFHARRALLAAAAGWPAMAGMAAMRSSTAAPRNAPQEAHSAVTQRGFVAADPPTPQSHASTLVALSGADEGTVQAAWFGGTAERAPDVRIWLARHGPQGWQAPVPVADGVQPDGERLPTWNPVLFQPRAGPLKLFYKVGPDPQRWWGMAMTSSDGGRHWTTPQRLPDRVLGPVRSKPLQLRDGSVLSPSSTEAPDGHWRIHFERSTNAGATWQRGDAVADPAGLSAIQPTLAQRPDGSVVAFARSRAGCIARTESQDGGLTWRPLMRTDLPNPNAGIEVLGLADGRWLMVFNPALPGADWWMGRDRLALAVSADGGRHWRHALTLEDEPGQEFSYPAAIQTRDGLVHLSYTARRTHIRHVVIDPARLR